MKCKHTKVQNALINMLLTHWWSKWSKYAQHGQCLFLSRDHYKLTSPAQSSIAFTSSFMFTWLIVPIVPLVPCSTAMAMFKAVRGHTEQPRPCPCSPQASEWSSPDDCTINFHNSLQTSNKNLGWEIEESINRSFTSRRRHLLFWEIKI